MTTLVAGTHVVLTSGGSTKDATVATGVLAIGAEEVGIKIPNPLLAGGNIQQYVGAFNTLLRFAKAELRDYSGATTFSVNPLGSISQIVTTGHVAADHVSLYVGANIINNQRSHDLDATFKQCIARFLEEFK